MHSVMTAADWDRRRGEILEGMQSAMGRLPDRGHLPPLDMKVTETAKGEGLIRLSISYLLGSGRSNQRVPAYLLIPDASGGERLPAMLALHQTTLIGKAAIAPRPFFSNSPLHDENFSGAGVKKAVPEIEKVYHLLHADRALDVVHPDCAHDFPLEIREQAYRFIDAALKLRPGVRDTRGIRMLAFTGIA